MIESDQLKKEIETLKEQSADSETLRTKIESLESSTEVLRKSEAELNEQNRQLKTDLEKKSKQAEDAHTLRSECEELKEKV